MTRRLTASLAIFLSSLALAAERPNIVIIMADDLGYSDLGCYGGEIKTPHLDRLALGGVRFTQFYNNAICTATRASLMSGLYPRQTDKTSLRRCVTIAEVLKASGYRTMMAGKWHLRGHPRKRGFERYYGLLSGGCNHFNPGLKRPGEGPPGKKFHGDDQPFDLGDGIVKPFTPKRGFYSTDAFTDAALRFLDQPTSKKKPFFLYLAYTVPHYPLHAPAADIRRYRGKYMQGWDVLRQARFKRLVSRKLIGASWRLPPRDKNAPAWQTIKDKEAWDLKMAVYAAMVDRMDHNIGRVVAKLKKLGQFQNTLLVFLSDNGPSDENRTTTPNLPPGPVESYRSVDLPWANLSNTPFRYFKRWNHQGGISTPMIVHWPHVIRRTNQICHRVSHIMDLMATYVEVAGAKYPREFNGHSVLPMEGKSLAPILREYSTKDCLLIHKLTPRTLFWNQRAQWRAVRIGDWKLVSPDHTYQYRPWRKGRKGRVIKPADHSLKPWELYNLAKDPTEINNLASKHPQRVKSMAAIYAKWDKRVRTN